MKHTMIRPLAWSQPLLLLALCCATACYDWQPPGAPPDQDDPAGQASAGAGAASSGGEPAAGGATVTSSAEASSVQASSSASTASSGSSASSSGAGPVDPAGVCDGAGNCDDCIACAVQGACEDLADACKQDLGCLAFMDCLGYCADDACVADCADGNEEGAQIFEEAATCVICQQCSLDCADLTDLTGCL
jgi:hypothetical protein